MTAIYDSPFLIALGWTIASSLWQAALLWLVYQAINSGGSKVSPSLKHSVAASFLSVSFVWFGVTFIQNYNEVAALKLSVKNVADHNITLARALFNISAEASPGSRLFTLINNFLPYLSAAYLIVLVILLIKLTRAYIFSIQLKTRGLIELDEQWIALVNKYARNIGISRKVKVFLSEKINVPATLDFFKPVILLPVATFNHLTVAQVESVLLHELAHIRRNDYLINIFASVIETVLFFNPFVHLLAQSLKKEREHCCDDLVLQYKFDPHSYASALLSLEKMRIGMQPLLVAATGESGQLLGRVKRIMNVKHTSFNYGQKLTALVVTALILLSLAWLSPSQDQNVHNAANTVVQYKQKDEIAAIKAMESPLDETSVPQPEALVRKKDTIQFFKTENNKTIKNIVIDSLFGKMFTPQSPSLFNLPATPPMPPLPPLPAEDITGKGMAFIPEYDSDFLAQYPSFKIDATENYDVEMDKERWEKVQKDIEEGYTMSLQAMEKSLKDIVSPKDKKINDIFQQQQKRLVAEKYLQQILGNKMQQREFQHAQQLLAEQKLQFNKVLKEQMRTDSIKAKSIRKKTPAKAIWINNNVLPEQINKQLQKMHIDAEPLNKTAYAININTDACNVLSNNVSTVVYNSGSTDEERDFSFDYQADARQVTRSGKKEIKTVVITSDNRHRSITICFQ